jgi:CRP/FNR family cyclic AMP-dependent transcriptional regulator
MSESRNNTFDVGAFLASAGLGRRIVHLKAKQVFFSQGNPADSIFYLQKGRAKLTVVSNNGKEATITLLSARDFAGEESLAAVVGLHMATATALTACTALRSYRPACGLRVLFAQINYSKDLPGLASRRAPYSPGNLP